MMRTRNKTLVIEYKKVASYAILILFVVFILYFAYAKTSHIWRGIDLTIHNIENGQIIEENLITIEGQARKAVKLTINGQNVYVNEEGLFTHPLAPQKGYNKITVEAEDKFGNKTTKTLEVNTTIN
jgi:hypothetical protein